MKIKKMKLTGHKVLGDLEIDFTDESGKPLDVVAFIGDNGVGKTQVLRSIVDVIGIKTHSRNIQIRKFETGVKLTDKLSITLVLEGVNSTDIPLEPMGVAWNHVAKGIEQKPFAVWMPVELNADTDSTFLSSGIYGEWIERSNEWKLNDINAYIIENINKAIYKDMSKPAKVAFDEESQEINDVFKGLDLGVKLIGLSGESGLPIFRNKRGEDIELKDLSSGEKQLFFRILSLKRLNVNNAIILIDEPETSLHPEWQRKIIDVYRNIGENNQIIIATHSPLILGSVPSEGVRVLSRNDEGVIQVEHGYQTYGKSAEDLLRASMNLGSLRHEKMEEKLEKARKLLDADSYESDEYKNLIRELKMELGSGDQDVMLIEMGASRRRRLRDKDKQNR